MVAQTIFFCIGCNIRKLLEVQAHVLIQGLETNVSFNIPNGNLPFLHGNTIGY